MWSDVSLAAFSAGLFAVHPVVVEPVTWVPGREELLMTMGTLGCLHFHLTFRGWNGQTGALPRRRLACFFGAAVCCGAACLSNAVGAVIPLLITVWDSLTLTKPKLRRVVSGTSLLWLIGLATILVKGRDNPTAAMETLPHDVFGLVADAHTDCVLVEPQDARLSGGAGNPLRVDSVARIS